MAPSHRRAGSDKDSRAALLSDANFWNFLTSASVIFVSALIFSNAPSIIALTLLSRLVHRLASLCPCSSRSKGCIRARWRCRRRIIVGRSFPDKCAYPVVLAENLVHQHAEPEQFDVIDADEDDATLIMEQLPQHGRALRGAMKLSHFRMATAVFVADINGIAVVGIRVMKAFIAISEVVFAEVALGRTSDVNNIN